MKIKDITESTIDNIKNEIKDNKFINDTLNEKLTLMNSVHRQSTMNTIQPENIAQHSFFVAFYALKIAKELGLSKDVQGEITIQALIHDIAETQISDIPGNIKQEFPQLKEISVDMEKDAVNKYFPEVSDEFFELQDHECKQDLIGTIIKIADILAFIQKCYVERSLGNNSTFLNHALTNSKKSITKYLNKLFELISDSNNSDDSDDSDDSDENQKSDKISSNKVQSVDVESLFKDLIKNFIKENS